MSDDLAARRARHREAIRIDGTSDGSCSFCGPHQRHPCDAAVAFAALEAAQQRVTELEARLDALPEHLRRCHRVACDFMFDPMPCPDWEDSEDG